MKTLQTVTLLAGILASGLMAGLFVGFAYSVMPGLGRSADRTMIEAMQNINKAIVNPWFLLLFVGPIPLLILAAVLAWRGQGRPALPWILAALALYLIAFLITSGVNVPLNDQLAEGGNPRHIHDLAAIRSDFESKWVAWNIARGLLHTAAFGCLAWALVSYGTHRTLSAADQVACRKQSRVRAPLPGLAISNGLFPGLAGVVKTLADEHGPSDIRIDGLLPVRIATDRVRHHAGMHTTGIRHPASPVNEAQGGAAGPSGYLSIRHDELAAEVGGLG